MDTPGAGLVGSRDGAACDVLLAWCVLALATWTLAYHACLLLDLNAAWAPWRWRRASRAGCFSPGAPRGARGAGRRVRRALPSRSRSAWPERPRACWPSPGSPWPPVWARPDRGGRGGRDRERGRAARARRPRAARRAGGTRVGVAVVAVLSLFLVRPNADDTYYVRQATWVAEHGRFPLGDTLHSHDVLPAVFSAELASFEPLLGALAGSTGGAAPALRTSSPDRPPARWRCSRSGRRCAPGAGQLWARRWTKAVVFLLTAIDLSERRGVNVDHLPATSSSRGPGRERWSSSPCWCRCCSRSARCLGAAPPLGPLLRPPPASPRSGSPRRRRSSCPSSRSPPSPRSAARAAARRRRVAATSVYPAAAMTAALLSEGR